MAYIKNLPHVASKSYQICIPIFLTNYYYFSSPHQSGCHYTFPDNCERPHPILLFSLLTLDSSHNSQRAHPLFFFFPYSDPIGTDLTLAGSIPDEKSPLQRPFLTTLSKLYDWLYDFFILCHGTRFTCFKTLITICKFFLNWLIFLNSLSYSWMKLCQDSARYTISLPISACSMRSTCGNYYYYSPNIAMKSALPSGTHWWNDLRDTHILCLLGVPLFLHPLPFQQGMRL